MNWTREKVEAEVEKVRIDNRCTKMEAVLEVLKRVEQRQSEARSAIFTKTSQIEELQRKLTLNEEWLEDENQRHAHASQIKKQLEARTDPREVLARADGFVFRQKQADYTTPDGARRMIVFAAKCLRARSLGGKVLETVEGWLNGTVTKQQLRDLSEDAYVEASRAGTEFGGGHWSSFHLLEAAIAFDDDLFVVRTNVLKSAKYARHAAYEGLTLEALEQQEQLWNETMT